MSSLQLSIKHLNKLKWFCRNVVQRQVFLSAANRGYVPTLHFFCLHFWMCCVNAVFKVLVGLRAEKQRDSRQEPNLAVPCDTRFCRHKDVMKNQSIYHQKYLVLSPQTVLEMSQNVIKTSSGFTFMKFQMLKEIGQSEMSQRNPCSDSRSSRNCRFSLDK